MRLICFWCVLLAGAMAQSDDYYEPQTFRQQPNYQRRLFAPADDVTPQGTTIQDPWRGPAPVNNNWRDAGPVSPKAEPWRAYPLTKEQQSAIIHHKQSLSSEGSFRFEYASDNGLAAGEIIEPDGSRIGGYQYKDPNGQTVRLKYKAGKDGFQILEGSHLPKSPEPVRPSSGDNYYNRAYEQQQQQYHLQQQYNQQRPEPQPSWQRNQAADDGHHESAGQQYVSTWRPQGDQDDGQYRENDVDSNRPHNFGEGYAFAFKG